MSEFRVDGRKIDLDVLTNYFLLGATPKEVAFFLGVGESQLKEWLAGYPEIAAAVERGSVLADALVAQSAFRCSVGYKARTAKVVQVQGDIRVVEYDHYYPPDANAAFKWLAQRRPDVWGPAKDANRDAERESRTDAVNRELESRIAGLAAAREKKDLARQPVAGRA
jgi:hypothetical protein